MNQPKAPGPTSGWRALARDPLNWIAAAGLLTWGWMALFHRPVGDYAVETDFYGDFVIHARRLMHGHLGVVDGFRGPFYYLLLGAVGELTRNYFLVGKLLSVLAAAASVRLVGGVVRRRWGGAAGVAAALFLAGNPVFAGHAFRASTDLVFLALFTASLALILRENPARLRGWVLGGALAGAAWLTRYTGAVLAPAAVAAAFLLVRPRRRALAAAALYAGAWAVVAAPWAIHLWRLTGDPFWNLNFQNVAIGVYTGNPGAAQQGRFMSSVGFASMAEVWKVDPARVTAAFASSALHHVLADVRRLVGPGWAGAALLGALLGFRPRRFDVALVAAACFTYLGLVPVFYNPRFMLPLLPFWAAAFGALAWAVAHPTGLAARLPRLPRVSRSVLVTAGLAAAALLAGAGNFQAIRASFDKLGNAGPPMVLARLAEKARQSGYPFTATTPIAARKPQIGYLLGAPVVPVPSNPVGTIGKTGARYLLVSGAETNADPSLFDLARLSDPSKSPPGLTLIARAVVPIGGGYERNANLFAVADPGPWSPPPDVSPRLDRPRLDGLSRIDTLRGKLAAWYLAWEPDAPVEGLFARMSPQARLSPPVLSLRGDAAFARRRPAEADSLYRHVLARDPGNPLALLRLAGLSFLTRKNGDYQNYLAAYARREFGAEEAGAERWFALGTRLQGQGLNAAAIAPLARSMERGKSRTAGLKALGGCLMGLGWLDKARVCFEEYLRLAPHDTEVRRIVDSLSGRPAR